MTFLRLYRRDALLAELELSGSSIDFGTRSGDGVRLDELGLGGAHVVGGRLERIDGAWLFTPRDPPHARPAPVVAGQRVMLGEASFELEPERPGARLLVAPAALGAAPLPALLPPWVEGPTSRRFHALAQLLTQASGSGPDDALFEHALEVAFGLVGAHHGLVARRESDGRTLRVIAARNLPHDDTATVLSQHVLDGVLGQGGEVRSQEPSGDGGLASPAPGARVFCALPFLASGRVVGLLYLDRGESPTPWSDDDLAFLRLLALVVARRLEEDERLRASQRQTQLVAGALLEPGLGEGRRLGWVSGAMSRLRQEAEGLLTAFQSGSLPVLITGESGTGKEVLARWLHDHLERRVRGPFVALNCAAIPHDLAETELFGIEKGVASGVIRRRGRFEQAQGGTLFLDEVGAMTLPVQAKLLRTLETRRVRRVGGHEEIPVDVRIVSATNASLAEAIRAGLFREDLYWRLAGVELHMPALRDRREDIPVLVEIFAEHFAREFGVPPVRLDRGALARLMAWSWPGNVRELRQRIGALTAAHAGGVVRAEDLPPELREPEGGPGPVPAAPRENVLRPLAEVELAHIRAVLRALGGDRRRAADVLGIHRKTLARRLGARPGNRHLVL